MAQPILVTDAPTSANDQLMEVGQVLEQCRSLLRASGVKTFMDDEAFILNEINPALVKLHQAASLLQSLSAEKAKIERSRNDQFTMLLASSRNDAAKLAEQAERIKVLEMENSAHTAALAEARYNFDGAKRQIEQDALLVFAKAGRIRELEHIIAEYTPAADNLVREIEGQAKTILMARGTLGRIADYSDYAGAGRAFRNVKDMARATCTAIDAALAREVGLSISDFALSPLGEIADILTEYDRIVEKFPSKDAEADFVMRGSDWREVREYIQHLNTPVATEAGRPWKQDADILAAAVDDFVRRGLLDARSLVADSRLDYGQPFSIEETEQHLSRRRHGKNAAHPEGAGREE